MSNSTSLLEQLTTAQAQKEVTANGLFDAHSPSSFGGRRTEGCSGLVWAYYGGSLVVDGTPTAIANGTVTLTASLSNYHERTRAGVFSANTTAFTAGRVPLYTIVTGASTVTSYTDHREAQVSHGVIGRLSLSVAGSSHVTLTAAQARNGVLNFTGLLTGSINVIVPDGPHEWTVSNNTTGAYTLTVKTTAGTGVAISQGSSALVFADGTNVVGMSVVGGGTVTSVSVTTANGVSGSVATATTTPAITLTLGAITPTTIVASSTIAGSNLSGTNTGDQTLSGFTVAQGGTGVATLTAYAPVFGGTTGTAAVQSGTAGTSGHVLTSNGAGVLPTFQAAGAPATTPVLIQIACSDEATALTTGTKVTFRTPYAFTLTAVRGSLTTAATGATLFAFDLKESGTTVFSTKPTLDASEKTTTTAATASVISDSAIADDAEMTIIVDAVGSTIAGAGLKVALIGTKP